MKSREMSRSKIGPFSLACTDSYIGIGWEYQSNTHRPYCTPSYISILPPPQSPQPKLTLPYPTIRKHFLTCPTEIKLYRN